MLTNGNAVNKYLCIFFQKMVLVWIFFLSPSTLAVAQQSAIVQQLDSLVQDYLIRNAIEVSAAEAIGVYNRTDGWGSESVALKESGKYRIRSSGCFGGPATTDWGYWKVGKASIFLYSRDGKRDTMAFVKSGDEIGLCDDAATGEWRLLTLDRYRQQPNEFRIQPIDSAVNLFIKSKVKD